MDVERDKHQELLRQHSALQASHESLQVNYEAKEQECLTISSFSQIQTG